MTDYGHAMAIVQRLERQAAICAAREGEELAAARLKASAEAKAAEIAAADWTCQQCGAVSANAQQTACEHSFAWNYDMTEPTREGARERTNRET